MLDAPHHCRCSHPLSLWLGIKTSELKLSNIWRWNKFLLVVMAAAEQGGVWLQTNVISVLPIAVWTWADNWMSCMLIHLHTPLFISCSLSTHLCLCLFSEGRCVSSNRRRTTHQNPWCHPAASSTTLQVSVGSCRNRHSCSPMLCTHIGCVCSW